MKPSEMFEGENSELRKAYDSAVSAQNDMTPKIIMYATADDGEGSVMKVGEYESIEDITIHTNIFAGDVAITFEYEHTNNNRTVEATRSEVGRLH